MLMANFLMKPKIDFAFKEIMMDESARIGFLSAILKLNPSDIRKTKNIKHKPGKTAQRRKTGYT